MNDGVRCLWMRGGTSKGAFFVAEDLPVDRDAFLLRIMGSPDERQIDGIGGADPLTSKVAVVKPSSRPGVDVDYLFLQVAVNEALVSDAQNCGNLLAGVGPFAIERGLVNATEGTSQVTVYMENSGELAVVSVSVKNGKPVYEGQTAIDGVPGTAAAVSMAFKDIAGSSCGALLPTGNAVDVVNGIDVTLIDNGMPVVLLRASDMGISGSESRADLDGLSELKARLESLRLACGPLMNLGDVKDKTVPKMTMLSPPSDGGCVSTRTFIPHRCHASIGVLGAVSVATGCLITGSVAANLANVPQGQATRLMIQHPSGATTIDAELAADGSVESTAIVRTARKLFDGAVFN